MWSLYVAGLWNLSSWFIRLNEIVKVIRKAAVHMNHASLWRYPLLTFKRLSKRIHKGQDKWKKPWCTVSDALAPGFLQPGEQRIATEDSPLDRNEVISWGFSSRFFVPCKSSWLLTSSSACCCEAASLQVVREPARVESVLILAEGQCCAKQVGFEANFGFDLKVIDIESVLVTK